MIERFRKTPRAPSVEDARRRDALRVVGDEAGGSVGSRVVRPVDAERPRNSTEAAEAASGIGGEESEKAPEVSSLVGEEVDARLAVDDRIGVVGGALEARLGGGLEVAPAACPAGGVVEGRLGGQSALTSAHSTLIFRRSSVLPLRKRAPLLVVPAAWERVRT